MSAADWVVYGTGAAFGYYVTRILLANEIETLIAKKA